MKRSPPLVQTITPRAAAELISHDAIVLEAYLDSVDVWTWGIGITNASGYQVYPRYRDRPAPLSECLNAFATILAESYQPEVEAAFEGHPLSEAEFAAALSFHYNTGAIGRAEWVQQVKVGERADARAAFMNWCRPAQILGRRQKECDLFFDGTWSSDGTTWILPVDKPSYRPNADARQPINIMDEVRAIFGG